MNNTPFTDFMTAALPTLRQLILFTPASLAWSGACLFIAGWLKKHRRWKTGYTRKLFHFLIFSTAAATQFRLGLPVLCIFGVSTSLWIALALLRGKGNMLYEAFAREKDAPHRTLYIVTPYMATLLGGTLANIYFGPAALAGYLVTGVADAVAEPIGTRFGKNTYRVPSLRSVKAMRSLEGSGAVSSLRCSCFTWPCSCCRTDH